MLLPFACLTVCRCCLLIHLRRMSESISDFHEAVCLLQKTATLISSQHYDDRNSAPSPIKDDLKHICKNLVNNVPDIFFREGFFNPNDYNLDYSDYASPLLSIPSIANQVLAHKGDQRPSGKGHEKMSSKKKHRLNKLYKWSMKVENRLEAVRIIHGLIEVVISCDAKDGNVQLLPVQVRVSSIINRLLRKFPELQYLIQTSVTKAENLDLSKAGAGFLQFYAVLLDLSKSDYPKLGVPKALVDKITTLRKHYYRTSEDDYYDNVRSADRKTECRRNFLKSVMIGETELNLAICFATKERLKELEYFLTFDPQALFTSIKRKFSDGIGVSYDILLCNACTLDDIGALFDLLSPDQQEEIFSIFLIESNVFKETRMVSLFRHIIYCHSDMLDRLNPKRMFTLVDKVLQLCHVNPTRSAILMRALLEAPGLDIISDHSPYALCDLHFKHYPPELMTKLFQLPEFKTETTLSDIPESIQRMLDERHVVKAFLADKLQRNHHVLYSYDDMIESFNELMPSFTAYGQAFALYWGWKCNNSTFPKWNLHWFKYFVLMLRDPELRYMFQTVNFGPLSKWERWYEEKTLFLFLALELFQLPELISEYILSEEIQQLLLKITIKDRNYS